MNLFIRLFGRRERLVKIPDVIGYYGYLSTAEKMGILLSVDEVFTQLLMAKGDTNEETIISFIEYLQVFVAERKLKDRVFLIKPYKKKK